MFCARRQFTAALLRNIEFVGIEWMGAALMKLTSKVVCRAFAWVLCTALLLPNFVSVAGAVQETATEAEFQEQIAIPDYEGGIVSNMIEFDGGNGITTDGSEPKTYMILVDDTTEEEFLTYCDKLSAAGFQQVFFNTTAAQEGDNLYARYLSAGGSYSVYTYYTAYYGEVRILIDTQKDTVNGYSYVSQTGESAVPAFYMYGLTMSDDAKDVVTSDDYTQSRRGCGAMHIIRMADNSLFIIDGGDFYQMGDEQAAELMAFCRKITGKEAGKVVINTWFLTHAHADHSQGFPRFMSLYHDQFELHNIMYSVESEYSGTSTDVSRLMKMIRSYYPDARYYKPHTGEKLNIAGMQIDILHTPEDRYQLNEEGGLVLSEHFSSAASAAEKAVVTSNNFNDTSVGIRASYDGVEALLLADLYKNTERVINMYAAEDLKADIFQIPHHGYNDQTPLCQVVEPAYTFYTQNKLAVTDPSISTNQRLLDNHEMMSPYLGKIYYGGNETVGLAVVDGALAEVDRADVIPHEYTGWSQAGGVIVNSTNFGSETAKVKTATKTVRMELVTGHPEYNERYVIVHDKTDSIMSYNAVAEYAYQSAPNTATSIAIGSLADASAGRVSAYYNTTLSSNGDPKYLYFGHDLRDTTLWILLQSKSSNYSTANIATGDPLSYTNKGSAVATYLGGTYRYHHTYLAKGNGYTFNEDGSVQATNNGAYWYSVKGNDEEGKQWRYLRLDQADMYGIKNCNTFIESYEDGTFLIYYKNGSKYHVLCRNEDGTWGYRVLTAAQVKNNLADLKVRLYECATVSSYKTIAYEGMQDYYILKGTTKAEAMAQIAANIKLADTTRRKLPVPCSGTKPKSGHYWLDGEYNSSVLDINRIDHSVITVKYRNDNGKDTVIGTVNVHIVDEVPLEISFDRSNNSGYIHCGAEQTAVVSGCRIDGVFNTYFGLAYELPIQLSMLTDANGNAVDTDVAGTYTGLTLTYQGRVLSTDFTLTVRDITVNEDQTMAAQGYQTAGEKVATTTKQIRFTLVTGRPQYNERYVIVHDKTNNIMTYSPVAETSGQTNPNAITSMKTGSLADASAGLVDAYFNSDVTNFGDPKYLYLKHEDRDAALWILQQTKSDTYGNTDIAKGDPLSNTSNGKAVAPYFGGKYRYHHAYLFKGNGPTLNEDGTVAASNNGTYWNSVKGNDVDGQQWRYLRLNESDVLGHSTSNTMIEVYADDTFLIYYKSGSTYRVLTMKGNGTWGYTAMTADEVNANLDNLKVRLYKYGTVSGTKTLTCEGMQDYSVLSGTSMEDVAEYISQSLRVRDVNRRKTEVSFTGTQGKIGYCWVDIQGDTDTLGVYTVSVKYRNDDGTDTVITTLSLHVVDTLPI